MTRKTLKVALLQLGAGAGQEQARVAAERALAEAAEAGATLALLPELHLHHYFCQTHSLANFALAEPLPGPYSDWLGEQSTRHGLVIVGSTFERREPGLYFNTAVVTDADGQVAGCYRKQHIPDDPGYHEKYYFTPGDGELTCIETSVGRLGVLVCWDQWFPEAARILALDGADLLLYPTAIGWDSADDGDEQARQHDAWQTVQRGHAIANGLPLLACNRIGQESAGEMPGQRFWGASFVAGPQGEVLARASHDQPETVLATIDWRRRDAVRRVWPFFRDRRIDRYSPILQRTAG
ncbi:MAG: nitrilase-related carbon-nitrogen hydrolase [Pseudomonadota bacterium]